MPSRALNHRVRNPSAGTLAEAECSEQNTGAALRRRATRTRSAGQSARSLGRMNLTHVYRTRLALVAL